MPSIRMQVALLSVAAACAAISCAKTDDGGCIDQVRAIGLDDSTATGMTVREIASRFHIGDVVWSCALSWASARQPAERDVVTARRDDDSGRGPALGRRRRNGGHGDGAVRWQAVLPADASRWT